MAWTQCDACRGTVSRLRSAHGPSQDSSAGRNVSDPTTVTPTTAIVPRPIPVKIEEPERNKPASVIITVRQPGQRLPGGT